MQDVLINGTSADSAQRQTWILKRNSALVSHYLLF